MVPEQAEKACVDLKKRLDNLEKAKAKEEENEKIVMDSLKDETKVRHFGLCGLLYVLRWTVLMFCIFT